jgi:WD40 repeat protein
VTCLALLARLDKGIHFLARPHKRPQVRSIAPDASGQWLLSGSDDGTAKLWEVRLAGEMQDVK